jgi:hypothetical protein
MTKGVSGVWVCLRSVMATIHIRTLSAARTTSSLHQPLPKHPLPRQRHRARRAISSHLHVCIPVLSSTDDIESRLPPSAYLPPPPTRALRQHGGRLEQRPFFSPFLSLDRAFTVTNTSFGRWTVFTDPQIVPFAAVLARVVSERLTRARRHG